MFCHALESLLISPASSSSQSIAGKVSVSCFNGVGQARRGEVELMKEKEVRLVRAMGGLKRKAAARIRHVEAEEVEESRDEQNC